MGVVNFGRMAKHHGAVSLASHISMDHRGCLHPKITCSASSDVFSCDINSSGDLLAASLANGSVMAFEMQSGSVVYKLASPYPEALPATSIKFRPLLADSAGLQNVALVAYSSGHVQQWHVSSGKSLSLVQEDRQTLVASYAPDASTYASSGSDHSIMIYDTSTSVPTATLMTSSSLTIMDGHVNRVFALQYHPTDPHLLVSAGWDDTVQFWDTRVEASIRKILGPHICGNALDIEPTTLNIVTGSWRQHAPLEVWDFHSGKLLSTSTSCSETKLYSACWMEHGYALVGGSLRHCAMVIDTVEDSIVGDLGEVVTAGVYNVAYSINSKYAAVATGDKIHLCYLPLPKRKTTESK